MLNIKKNPDSVKEHLKKFRITDDIWCVDFLNNIDCL